MNFLRGVKRGFVSNFVDSSILEQPPYDVLGKGSEYEERYYPGGNWIFTVVREHVEEVYEDNGTVTSFFQLQKYLNGENEDGAVMELTFPVLVRVSYDPENNKRVLKGEMAIYIHSSRQENPPKPKSENLFIERLEPMKVYARRFSGYAGDKTYMSEKDVLRECLTRDGLVGDIDDTVSFAGGYDAPTKMFNRRNEVWFQILEEDAAQEAEPGILTTTNPDS